MKAMMKLQRGIVILEGLIAILIFSLGILGIVGLLAASIRNNASAKYRTDASMLANQVVGQMWVANKVNTSLKTNFESPNGAGYAAWKTDVANVLPGAEANAPTIEIDADNVATINIRWQAPGEAAAHSYVLVARING